MSTYSRIYLSIFSSAYLSVYLAFCLSASLKTNMSRQTSLIFDLDTMQNEAILQDLLDS